MQNREIPKSGSYHRHITPPFPSSPAAGKSNSMACNEVMPMNAGKTGAVVHRQLRHSRPPAFARQSLFQPTSRAYTHLAFGPAIPGKASHTSPSGNHQPPIRCIDYGRLAQWLDRLSFERHPHEPGADAKDPPIRDCLAQRAAVLSNFLRMTSLCRHNYHDLSTNSGCFVPH